MQPNPPLPTPEQLEAWSALCEAATPGPWEYAAEMRPISEFVHYEIRTADPQPEHPWSPRFVAWLNGGRDVAPSVFARMDRYQRDKLVDDGVRDDRRVQPDAEFIATARTALPSLLAAYRDRDDAIKMAWVIICNASGGNWDLQSEEWREAARKWGDANYGPLSARRSQQAAGEENERLRQGHAARVVRHGGVVMVDSGETLDEFCARTLDHEAGNGPVFTRDDATDVRLGADVLEERGLKANATCLRSLAARIDVALGHPTPSDRL